MPMKKYTGSCHCGAVRFEADLDLSQGTMRCNCSHCTKVRTWFTIAAPEKFRLIEGDDAQQVYEWIPPNRDAVNLHFRFCKTCGVRTPGFGDHGPDGKNFVFIPVALLDGTDPDELAASLHYLDGKHDRFDRQPADIRLM